MTMNHLTITCHFKVLVYFNALIALENGSHHEVGCPERPAVERQGFG